VSASPSAAGSRGDGGVVAWGHTVPSTRIGLGTRSVVWDHHQPTLRSTDLIIIEQAMRNLTNVGLFARSLFEGPPVALWGHGRRFQSEPGSALPEHAKAFITRRAHWFFAYTDLSAAIVEGMGVPADRITVVNNAIDTHRLWEDMASVTADDLRSWRDRMGIRGRDVCVYSGGLYPGKRLRFLLAAADLMRAHNREFELVAMGGGEDLAWLREAARLREWLHVPGPTFGRDKTCALTAGRLLLMPGVVGLVVLDAFTLGTPMVTIANRGHGPEISYLAHELNGLMLPSDTSIAAYAAAAQDLLDDPQRYRRLVGGGLLAAQQYSVEAMAARFAQGVLQALSRAPRRVR
jgi:glycosyltransferase involved in cell wall biosynthesis